MITDVVPLVIGPDSRYGAYDCSRPMEMHLERWQNLRKGKGKGRPYFSYLLIGMALVWLMKTT